MAFKKLPEKEKGTAQLLVLSHSVRLDSPSGQHLDLDLPVFRRHMASTKVHKFREQLNPLTTNSFTHSLTFSSVKVNTH